MKTITICGGGLAGLSLAIALRKRGVPVVVHEAGRYPRHRVCGEFISGVATETLRALGIEALFEDAEQLRSTQWFLRGRQVMSADLPEPALGISRYRLDQRLAKLFEQSGGELQTDSRRVREGQEGQVWAAGRKPNRDSEWIGLKMHVSGLQRKADLEMHIGKGGYVGLAPIEDGRVNLCGLFRRQAVRGKGRDLLRAYLEAIELGELSEGLAAASCHDESFVGVSAFELGRQDSEEGLCVLGDAESMIPPFTGNGMSMAFEAAESALGPLQAWSQGAEAWEAACNNIRERLAERFQRRLFTARVLHPFLLSAAGRNVLALSARSGLIPFRPLLRLLR